MEPSGWGRAGEADWLSFKAGPTVGSANLHPNNIIKVCNITSGLVDRRGKQKETKDACVWCVPDFGGSFRSGSEVLPGRRPLPPPGAVSTEARLRLLSPSPFFPLPRETSVPLSRLLRISMFGLLSTLTSSSSLAASSRLSPTPSLKMRHSLISLPVTQHFFQLIGPVQAPLLSLLATLLGQMPV